MRYGNREEYLALYRGTTFVRNCLLLGRLGLRVERTCRVLRGLGARMVMIDAGFQVMIDADFPAGEEDGKPQPPFPKMIDAGFPCRGGGQDLSWSAARSSLGSAPDLLW